MGLLKKKKHMNTQQITKVSSVMSLKHEYLNDPKSNDMWNVFFQQLCSCKARCSFAKASLFNVRADVPVGDAIAAPKNLSPSLNPRLKHVKRQAPLMRNDEDIPGQVQNLTQV